MLLFPTMIHFVFTLEYETCLYIQLLLIKLDNFCFNSFLGNNPTCRAPPLTVHLAYLFGCIFQCLVSWNCTNKWTLFNKFEIFILFLMIRCIWTRGKYNIALISSTETLLMIMASFVDSQCELGDSMWEYWAKRLNRSSSSYALCNGSALSVWLSCVKVMVLITSFTVMCCDLGVLYRVLDPFCKVYFSPILLGNCFIILTVDEM